jgi:hypothetical protein
MSQRHISRTSENPYIDRVWATENLTDGVYKATPDGCWDLIACTDRDGKKTMMLTGQASKTTMVPYESGTNSVVISFAAGAYMPQMPGKAMLDLIEMLPNAGNNNFVLLGHTFQMPTYQTAEDLVVEMEKQGLLAMDEVVAAVLQGTPKAMSDRHMQRHFMQATGLTRKALEQIHRAQKAVGLIKSGLSPSSAAADAGFSDQPHLTKSLQKLMHSRPSDVSDIHKL